jgi:hypothetical protein
LTLAEVALCVGDFFKGLFGFGLLLVEESVKDCWKNAPGVWEVVSLRRYGHEV